MTPPSSSRRRFLAGGALGCGALILGACSSTTEPPIPAPPPPTGPDKLDGDLAIAALLVSIENLLVQAYDQGLDFAAKERLGAVPPAVLTAIQTSRQQHREHAQAWNGILTGAGRPGITGTNLSMKTTTDPSLARVRDVPALLTFVLDVETISAATYLSAVGALQNNAAIKVAASIHPAEAAHVAAFAFLLGRFPVPEAFARTDGARTTGDSIG